MWHIQYYPLLLKIVPLSWCLQNTSTHFLEHILFQKTYQMTWDFMITNHTANTICISRESPAHPKGKTSSVGARKGHHLIKKTMYICISTHCLTKQQTATTSTASHKVSEQRTWRYSMNKGNYFPLWKLWLVKEQLEYFSCGYL